MEHPLILFLDLLKIIIPSLLVFLTSYYVLRNYLDNDYKKQLLEIKSDAIKATLPMRLQAYERCTLFLDRISPNNLLVRVQGTSMSAKELQSILLGTIRQEFEHNVTQQLYVSAQAWEVITSVKEETVRMINNATMGLAPQASGLDLSKTILEHLAKQEQNPYLIAVAIMKNEVQKLF